MAISLQSIQKTKHATPPRILIHGGEKVGKSTFFAHAPAPIFIQTEDGLNGIDTNAFPLAESLDDVTQALNALINEPHQFKTVVIDSADWLERLIFEKVCQDDKVKTIELAAGGYGKGYTVSLNHWRDILAKLKQLNDKGMIIGVVCHSAVIPFNDPEHEPYDRFEMKLYQPKGSSRAGSRDLLCEWADIIGFASKKRYISKNKDTGVVRGVNANESNKLHLIGSPAFVAGNRYSLPDVIDLSWSAFEAAITGATQTKAA